MIYLKTIISSIEEHCIFSRISIPSFDAVNQIKMLSFDSAREETPNCIYCCDIQQVTVLLGKNCSLKGKTVLAAGENSDFDFEFESDYPCNLLVFNCDIASLFNAVSDNIKRLTDIEKRICDIPVRKSCLHSLLNIAVMSLDVSASIIVTSPTFQIIDTAQNQIKHMRNTLDSISVNSYLSHKEVLKLLSCCADVDELHDLKPSKSINITIPMKDSECVVGYIVFWSEESGFGVMELLRRLSEIIPLFLSETNEQNYDSIAKDFAEIAEYVLLTPEIDFKVYKEKMRACPDRTGVFVRTVVIDFDSNRMSLQKSINKLKEIFSTNNICLLDKKLIVWLSGNSHIVKPAFDEDEFDRFLKSNNCYAIISNAAHYRIGLQTLFLQAKEILELLPDMPYVLRRKNFVFFNDIIQYYLIYLCSRHMSEHYGHNRLTYLAGPEIMGIIQYDTIHGTNNLEFLYSYISCGCNAKDTAEAMHMHRNTVNNHLNSISELLGEDIRDQRVANRVSISCFIMLFATKTLRQENRIIIGKQALEKMQQETVRETGDGSLSPWKIY